MNNAQQKQIVDFLLKSTATKLLSGSPVKSKISTEARSAYNRIRATYSENDVQGVDMIERIVSGLIWKLVRCENTEALEQAVAYIDALEKGEVLIAQEGGELTTQAGGAYNGH